jgi:hypothetical protein
MSDGPLRSAIAELGTVDDLDEFWPTADKIIEAASTMSELRERVTRELRRSTLRDPHSRVTAAWRTFSDELAMLSFAGPTLEMLERHANSEPI